MADVVRSVLLFRKSSRCTTGGCVEVAVLSCGDVVVRDSTDSARKPLRFNNREWCSFVSGVRNGQFDL
ncbi:MAG: DUF397 domain-containing protein [Pseudonocardiaceae bacterium]